MRRELNVAKWVLLVFVCCEIVSLLIAFVMRFCVDPEGHYSNFDDEEVCVGTRVSLLGFRRSHAVFYDQQMRWS